MDEILKDAAEASQSIVVQHQGELVLWLETTQKLLTAGFTVPNACAMADQLILEARKRVPDNSRVVIAAPAPAMQQ